MVLVYHPKKTGSMWRRPIKVPFSIGNFQALENWQGRLTVVSWLALQGENFLIPWLWMQMEM
jgi:hypothetical protein